MAHGTGKPVEIGGFRQKGLGFKALGFRVSGLGFRGSGLGAEAQRRRGAEAQEPGGQ